jgi:hypothetical protein
MDHYSFSQIGILAAGDPYIIWAHLSYFWLLQPDFTHWYMVLSEATNVSSLSR